MSDRIDGLRDSIVYRRAAELQQKVLSLPITFSVRLILFLSILLFYSLPVYSSDSPFAGPGNWGGTGLMEIPTARVMEDGHFRFGVGLIDPYLHYYSVISPVKGLELDFRMTEVLGTEITSPGWEGYGNNKTKVIDAKYQIIPERKYLPAIAVGIMDPHGTRQYASQFLVASKQIYPFDFTLGFGNGRYGEKPLPSQGEGFQVEMFEDPRGWLRDSRFFWGIQYAASENLLFMVEYNPIRYHKQTSDLAYEKYFRDPVPSEYNIGLRYNLWDVADIDLSFQRGDAVGVNVSMPFEIGRPLIPLYDQPYEEQLRTKLLPLQLRLISALSSSGFGHIGVEMIDNRMVIDLQNHKYFYATRALDVVLLTIAPIVAQTELEDIRIIFKDNGMPLSFVHVSRDKIIDYVKYQYTSYASHVQPEFNTEYIDIPDNRKRPKTAPFVLGFKPQINFLLNDPSGFFKSNLGLSLWASLRSWTGGSVIAGVSYYPFNEISSANEPLSIPVRTDVVDFLNKKVLFDRLLINQLYRIPRSNFFTSVSAGYLEMQDVGLDAEIATSIWGGRAFLGLNSSIVKKRDPGNPFKLQENTVKDVYTTVFLNTRLNFAAQDISMDIKFGRFLAGDIGTLFTVSKFIRSMKFSVWYSFTDTSVFNDPYNRDYHEKGISVSIPIRLIRGTDSKTAYDHSISPWTRDVARDITHYRSLFDVIGRNVKVFLRKDVGMR